MIAFYLPGGIPIFAFSLLLAFGAATGLAWVAARAPKRKAQLLASAGLWALLGGLAGGRAAFVTYNWPYFQDHLGESFQIFAGGMAWPGAMAGSLLALALFAAFTRQSFLAIVDGLLPLGAAVTLSAWLGCWLDGSAYGPLTSAWWGVPARDEWGELAYRFPTQLSGALLTLGLFWLLDRTLLSRRAPARGQAAGLGVLGLSFQLLALSLLRADPAPAWRGVGLDGWAALVFAALALMGLLVSFFRNYEATRS